MFEHLSQRLLEQFQIVFGKTGLLGEKAGNEAMRHVEAVRGGVFAAHGAVIAFLRLGFRFGGDSHAGDGVLLCNDGVDGAGESELHQPEYLTTLDASELEAHVVKYGAARVFAQAAEAGLAALNAQKDATYDSLVLDNAIILWGLKKQTTLPQAPTWPGRL